MSLVSGNRAMTMSPLRPDGGEIIEKKVAKGLSIVHYHLFVSIDEAVKALFETVTSTILEFLEKVCGVISFAYFIGIIKECMRIRRISPLESLADMIEIILHTATIEMIYHVTFSSRSGTFHHHHSIFLPQCDDSPCAFTEFLLLSSKRHEISLLIIAQSYESVSLGSVLLSLKSINANKLRILCLLCWRSHSEALDVFII